METALPSLETQNMPREMDFQRWKWSIADAGNQFPALQAQFRRGKWISRAGNLHFLRWKLTFPALEIDVSLFESASNSTLVFCGTRAGNALSSAGISISTTGNACFPRWKCKSRAGYGGIPCAAVKSAEKKSCLRPDQEKATKRRPG